jgi:polyferredoxin
MDACDEVMIKIDKPTGLIRYASFNSIKDGIQRIITPRVIGYSVVLVALLSFLIFNILTRSDIETTVLKVSGTLYQRTEDGFITNLYNVEFVNKTFKELPIELKVESPAYATLEKPDGKPLIIPAEGMLKAVYFIKIPLAEIKEAKSIVYLGVYENDKLLEKVKVKFIGPISSFKKMKP